MDIAGIVAVATMAKPKIQLYQLSASGVKEGVGVAFYSLFIFYDSAVTKPDWGPRNLRLPLEVLERGYVVR